jgi:hypothetical protein
MDYCFISVLYFSYIITLADLLPWDFKMFAYEAGQFVCILRKEELVGARKCTEGHFHNGIFNNGVSVSGIYMGP